jgi:hypothetical protein
MRAKILKEVYWGSYQDYLGLLRDEKIFNLGDDVFIGWGKENVFKSKIIGIEIIYNDGNSYKLYKVTIPKDVFSFGFDNAELICDTIFYSLEEARQSRLKCIEKKYKLEVDNINRFFNKHKLL